jgi:hypothetical protein
LLFCCHPEAGSALAFLVVIPEGELLFWAFVVSFAVAVGMRAGLLQGVEKSVLLKGTASEPVLSAAEWMPKVFVRNAALAAGVPVLWVKWVARYIYTKRCY